MYSKYIDKHVDETALAREARTYDTASRPDAAAGMVEEPRETRCAAAKAATAERATRHQT